MSKEARDIIKKPIITERSTEMMESNKYVFEVDIKSNKSQIKKAVEEIFEVKVTNVNTMNVKAKPKTFGKYKGFTSRRKKAIVTLAPDSKPLEFFEGA